MDRDFIAEYVKVAKQIASNTIAQVGARFVNAAISVVIIKLITSYMAAEGYGKYTQIYEFIAIFGIIADLGIFTIAVNEMAKAKDKMERILGNMLSIRLILVGILGTLAAIIAYCLPIFSVPDMRIGILVAAAGMAVNLLSITIASILQVHLKMTYNALAIVIGKLFLVAHIWAVTAFGWGFIQLIVAGLISNTIVLILTTIFAAKFGKIRLYYDKEIVADLFRKSFVYGLSLIFGAIYLSIGILILKTFWNDSVVGIYGVAYKVYQLLIIIPFAFMNSALPSLVRAMDIKWRRQDILQNITEVLSILGFGLLGGILFLSDEIIAFISSGTEFAPASLILNIFAISVLFTFLFNIFSYLLLVLNKQLYLMWFNAAGAAGSIIIALILVPLSGWYGGSNGLAIANIIAPLTVLIGSYWACKKFVEFKIRWWSILRIMLAAVGMMLVLWLCEFYLPLSSNALKTVVYTAIGGSAYFIFLIVFGGLSPQALELIFRKKRFQVPATEGNIIAVDIRSITGEKTGKEWYTLNLLESLATVDSHNVYILYTKYADVPVELPPNFVVRRFNIPVFLWHPVVFFDLWRLQVKYWLAPASYIIPSMLIPSKMRLITVIHDTVAFMFPKKHQMKARLIEKITVGLALRWSYRIIAVSENTKKDINKYFAGHNDKIVVIGESARNAFKKIEDKNVIKRTQIKYELPSKYIIFVGTLEPRKNLVRLINAFSLLTPDLQKDYPLVIVGKKGWYYNEIFQAIEKRNVKEFVHFTGYVPDEDLPLLLNGASLFVMPSLYEGFGLPILEAQACGIPVISSNTPALVEVLNEESITFDPKDEFAIAEAMKTVLTDKALRDRLRQKGLEESQKYSWEHVAEEFVKLFT